MSYAVVLPVTDLEHVMDEIKRQKWAEDVLRRTRQDSNAWQNWYRHEGKKKKHETVK